ncbi:hypothetical protein M8J75_000598 [Diaphorina citri]|nr:hypothetical protein M8J75_000598 [Diaphorina citri]
MAKTKKNRKSTVDLIKKVSKKQASLNPFEVHVNKAKFNVLGQKSKNDVGLPGVSRNKAIQKRKVTLLQEYKFQDKANKFFDRRIGEHNKNMTKEDKIMARFTAEKMKAHNKQASLFNLDDDIVLTHQGRTLEEIEQFEDPRSDEEDDDDGRNMNGKLDSAFVKEAHFGGGMLSESTTKLTEQLDTEWKDLLPLLNPIREKPPSDEQTATPPPPRPPPPKPAVDKNSFDFLVKELRFEATGKPSDKLKSEDEIVRQEKEKLEKLERERIKRMNLHDDGNTKARSSGRAYKSADDLDDGFAFESLNNEEDDDSETSDKEEDKTADSEEEEDEEEEIDEDEEEEEADESMEEDNGQRKDSERKGSKRKLEDDNEEKEEDEESEEEEDDEDEGSEEDEDSFDDLVDNEDSDDSSDESETERNEALTKSSSEAKNKSKLKSNEDKSSETKSGKADETKPSKTPDEKPSDKKKKVTKESDQETPLETKGKETRGVKTGEKNSSSGAGKKSLRFTESETDEENGKDYGKSSKRKADRKTESQEHMEQYTESEKDKRDGETKEKDKKDEETKGKDKKDGETKGKDKRKDEPKGILKNARNQNEEEELRNVRQPSEEKISAELTHLGTELPFTFDIPGEYEEMVALFQGRTVKEVKVILERMIKVNHWSLGGDNKARLSQLFAFLLQYLDDSVDPQEPKKCWQVLNALSPILFDLCLMDPDSAGGYVRGVIQEKYQIYARRDSRFPSVHSLVFLKLVSTLFPTSDARHYVTTPALIFLCHALGRSSVICTRDTGLGVFLATLCVEYIDLSKRYVPELINFLTGSLLLFCTSLPLPLTRPFKPSSKHLLVIHRADLSWENVQDNSEPQSEVQTITHLRLSAADLFSTERNPSTLFKLKILRSLLHLLAILVDKYSHYDASYLIFSNIEAILRQISTELSSEGDTSKASGEKEKIVEEGKANGVNNAGKTKANSENEKSNGKETKDEGGKETSGQTPTKKGRIGKKQKSKPDRTVESEEIEKKEENKVETEKGEHIKKENLNQKEKTKKESQTAALDAPSDPTSLADQLLAEITAALDLLSRTKTAHPFTYVAKEKEKPKILRLFEPEIKPVLKFHTKGSQKEREKLLHKYKKEMKGAIREIRKDGRFISKVKLREQTRRDEERKRKVKEILGGCAQQEGEIRNLKRKKK